MDFWYLFRVVPRYLILGRIRYFPERFPHPRFNPGNMCFWYCHLWRSREYLLFSFPFPFPLFPLASTTSFHSHPHTSIHSPPHKLSTSPSTSPTSTHFSSTSPHTWQATIGQGEHLIPHVASSYWPRDTSPSYLQLSPSQLFNCNFFTKSQNL